MLALSTPRMRRRRVSPPVPLQLPRPLWPILWCVLPPIAREQKLTSDAQTCSIDDVQCNCGVLQSLADDPPCLNCIEKAAGVSPDDITALTGQCAANGNTTVGTTAGSAVTPSASGAPPKASITSGGVAPPAPTVLNNNATGSAAAAKPTGAASRTGRVDGVLTAVGAAGIITWLCTSIL